MYQILSVLALNQPPNIESYRWAGYRFVVAINIRDREDLMRSNLLTVNNYGGSWQIYATCINEEAAVAAKRLLEL